MRSLRDARSLPGKGQEALRQRVVKAVRQGMSQTEAGRLFGVARGTVNRWISLWERQGAGALKARRRGRPRQSRLAPAKARQTVKLISSHRPDQLRLPFVMWTREAVQQLLVQRFNLRVSVWTVGRYLRGWGLTPQKPVRRAYEQNPALIRTWLETEYPARGNKVPTSVPQRARRRHAYIVFVDEAGFMLNSLVRRTWAPRGQTPVIKFSEPHGRISVIAAITISPVRRHFGFYFCLLADGLNFHGYSVARFVEDVHHRIGDSITLVWDSIPIHSARPVRDYLAAHRRIVVEPFPPYAPELNPVDNAWGYVKYNRLANYTPHNLDELRKRIMAEFRRLQKRPDLLQAFFKRTGLGLGP